MTTTIVKNREVRSGAPCVNGTRLSVADVVFAVTYGGVQVAEATNYHSVMVPKTILRCLEYCASQECKVSQLQSYCEGCTLDASPVSDDDDLPEDVWVLARKKLSELGGKSMSSS